MPDSSLLHLRIQALFDDPVTFKHSSLINPLYAIFAPGGNEGAWTTENPQADPSNPSKGFRRTGRASLLPTHDSTPANGHPRVQSQERKSDQGKRIAVHPGSESPPEADGSEGGLGNPWASVSQDDPPVHEDVDQADVIEDTEEEEGMGSTQ